MTALLGKKMENKLALIASSIKSIPNYPKPGIIFRDITSLVENPSAFHAAIELIVQHVKAKGITKVIGTESRGFIFGAPVALALNVPFVLVRKPGKLPRETIAQSYELEYGQDTLEIYKRENLTQAACRKPTFVRAILGPSSVGSRIFCRQFRQCRRRCHHAIYCRAGLGGASPR